MRDVVIVSAVRTPLGSFGGTLESISGVDLGAIVIREAVKRAGIQPEQVDEVIMGNVLSAAAGQNPARQAAIKAGIPQEVQPGLSIRFVVPDLNPSFVEPRPLLPTMPML